MLVCSSLQRASLFSQRGQREQAGEPSTEGRGPLARRNRCRTHHPRWPRQTAGPVMAGVRLAANPGAPPCLSRLSTHPPSILLPSFITPPLAVSFSPCSVFSSLFLLPSPSPSSPFFTSHTLVPSVLLLSISASLRYNCCRLVHPCISLSDA